MPLCRRESGRCGFGNEIVEVTLSKPSGDVLSKTATPGSNAVGLANCERYRDDWIYSEGGNTTNRSLPKSPISQAFVRMPLLLRPLRNRVALHNQQYTIRYPMTIRRDAVGARLLKRGLAASKHYILYLITGVDGR
jgi:hypothetical protein